MESGLLGPVPAVRHPYKRDPNLENCQYVLSRFLVPNLLDRHLDAKTPQPKTFNLPNKVCRGCRSLRDVEIPETGLGLTA